MMELNRNVLYRLTYSPLSDDDFEWSTISVPVILTEIWCDVIVVKGTILSWLIAFVGGEVRKYRGLEVR